MDRNALFPLVSAFQGVALRKESVDRNRSMPRVYRDATMSLSARRAWIEMSIAIPTR